MKNKLTVEQYRAELKQAGHKKAFIDIEAQKYAEARAAERKEQKSTVQRITRKPAPDMPCPSCGDKEAAGITKKALSYAGHLLKTGLLKLQGKKTEVSEIELHKNISLCVMNKCGFFNKEKAECGKCGCPVFDKCKSKSQKCPVGYWDNTKEKTK